MNSGIYKLEHIDVDTVRLTPVVEAAKEIPYPRAYKGYGERVLVVFNGMDRSTDFYPDGKRCCTSANCEDEIVRDGLTLLTGPERDEYVAAAREGRDAVWPRKEKWWWFYSDSAVYVVREYSDGTSEFWSSRGEVAKKGDNKRDWRKAGYTEISPSEA